MENNDVRLNPWVSIWTKPRKTIRQIIDSGSNKWIFVLISIGGIVDALNNASGQSRGDNYSLTTIVVGSIISGPIFGIVGLYVGSAILRWTGKWIGGKGEIQDIRTAIAWANIPIIWSLVLWVPELIIFKEEIFTSETPRIDASNTLAVLWLIFAAIEIVLAVWSAVIFLKSLGEAQGFSAWKALGNVLLSVLIIMVPIIILVVALMSF